MLLCNSESYSMMPYSCWNVVFYCKNQPKWKKRNEWSVIQIVVSICFLPIHSIIVQTSFLVLLLLPGVPPQVVASGLRPGPERSPQAFNGCIHNVRINGEPQDLSYRAAGGRPQGVGVVITSEILKTTLCMHCSFWPCPFKNKWRNDVAKSSNNAAFCGFKLRIFMLKISRNKHHKLVQQ